MRIVFGKNKMKVLSLKNSKRVAVFRAPMAKSGLQGRIKPKK